jgi:hypothetical protein
MTAQLTQTHLLTRARLASGATVAAQYSFAYAFMEVTSVSCVASVGAGGAVAIALNGALAWRWVCPRAAGAPASLGRYLLFAALGIGGLAVLFCSLLHLVHLPHWIAWGASGVGLFFALSSVAARLLVPRQPSAPPQLGPAHKEAVLVLPWRAWRLGG